jgi:16S rRNA processing protein RimM
MSERVKIGQIVGAFGIKGLVKIEPTTSFMSRFEVGNTVWLDGKPLKILSSTMHKGRPLLKFPGVETMSAAEALQWKFIEAEGEPELDEDEYLIEDLIGLSVVTETGESVGVVDDIEDYPAHQVVIIGEIMIPLIDEFVKDIDLDAQTMTVKLLYGMRPGEE